MEGFCRGCLNKYNEPTDLFQYSESNRRLFIYCTGLQVKRNDTFTFQLCEECYINMKFSCKFKKQCRNSDKKLKSYLALKKNEESIDFCSYLKNAEDTLILRLPKSQNSTPVHQRTEDDDNVSTCTSIQNFMTDMLQGEEMPPTEARIIQEVIQEEADILDDSLDSHWLQDDVSIDNDFGTNFNFSASSTPRSINNDHCYTPRRFNDGGEELNYYTSEKNVGSSLQIKTHVAQKNDMPTLDDGGINDDVSEGNIAMSILETGYDIENIEPTNQQPINTAHESDMPLLEDYNIELDGVEDNIEFEELENRYCVDGIKESDKDLISIKEKSQDSDVFLQSKVAEITAENNPFAKLDIFKDNLFSVSNDFSPFANSEVSMTNKETSQDIVAQSANKNEFSIIINKGITAEKYSDSPLTRELEFYLNKVELNKTSNKRASNDDVNKVLNTEDNMYFIKSQGQVEKPVNQSPLTNEIEKYIINAKLKKAIEPESNSSDKVLSILKGDTNITNSVQGTEKYIHHKLDKGKNIKNIKSPLKHELEHYINKIELKKKTNNTVSDQNNKSDNYGINEKCPIDRNLELALRNDDSQEFSLDQLLISPKVSIRSGASTPTINNILFGSMTPIHNNTNLAPILGEIAAQKELDPIDYFESSTPKKEFQEQESEEKIKLKRLKKIKEHTMGKCIKPLEKHEESIPKKHNKQTRGFKDIKKLKDLFKLENNDQTSEVSDDDQSHSIKDESTSIMKKEIDDQTVLQLGETEDLDISISSLLNFDENQSVDLNVSISSDFLKEDPLDHCNSEQKCADGPFKRPFSPPDNMYDMEICLCKICNKKFGSSRALKIHFMKTHKLKLARKKYVNNVPKICQLCGEQFTDKSNLNRHLKKHEDPSDFQCDYCTLHFATKGRLSQHMRAHASEIARNGNKDEKSTKDNKSKKKFVCSTCGKVSTTMANFKVHQRRHTKSYTVKCKVCEAGFYRTQDLNIHMAKHDGTKTFACELCPKVYSRRDLLMGHMYRHLNKKRFACEICDLHFISKHSLKTHYSSKMCLKKRDDLAKAARKSSIGKTVRVIHSVGSTEQIRKIMETENPEESNTESLEVNKENNVTEDLEKEAPEKSNDNADSSTFDKINIVGTENPDNPECTDLSKKAEVEPSETVDIRTDLAFDSDT